MEPAKSQVQAVNGRHVMIIRQAPELVKTGLTKAIGEPEDYNKNLERGNFPLNTDIRIPA